MTLCNTYQYLDTYCKVDTYSFILEMDSRQSKSIGIKNANKWYYIIWVAVLLLCNYLHSLPELYTISFYVSFIEVIHVCFLFILIHFSGWNEQHWRSHRCISLLCGSLQFGILLHCSGHRENSARSKCGLCVSGYSNVSLLWQWPLQFLGHLASYFNFW